jgi:hypothetical protein
VDLIYPMIKEVKTIFAVAALTLAISLAVALPLKSSAQYIGNDSALGIVRFYDKQGTILTSAKAFGIQWFHGKKLLLCPCQSVAPSSSQPVGTDVKDLWPKVASGEVYDLKEESVVATTGRALSSGKPLLNSHSDNDWTQDMMAFDLQSNPHLPLLPIAPSLVPLGTRVWVLSRESPPTSRDAERFPGTVTMSKPGGIAVTLARKLMDAGTTGAPIVNAKNEMVGMLIGFQGNEHLVIVGIPSTAIYARLWKDVPR